MGQGVFWSLGRVRPGGWGASLSGWVSGVRPVVVGVVGVVGVVSGARHSLSSAPAECGGVVGCPGMGWSSAMASGATPEGRPRSVFDRSLWASLARLQGADPARRYLMPMVVAGGVAVGGWSLYPFLSLQWELEVEGFAATSTAVRLFGEAGRVP